MSARRLTIVEQAAFTTRKRCIEELLDLAAGALTFDLEYARGYYRAAWMLASSIEEANDWPTPSEWIGWAREALEHREAA